MKKRNSFFYKINGKKRLLKVLFATIIIFVILFFSGCSVVFRASLNGTFVDKDDENGINDATVLIYTNEDDFNTDWSTLQNDSTSINSLSNYYDITTTQTEGNEDGHFSFSGIVWKNLFPEFGKDADRIEVYFIFWHEDYEPQTYKTYITSDTTNSLPPVKGTKAKDYATIKGTVVDANTNEGVANVNVRIYVPTDWSYDTSGNVDTSTLKFSNEADYNLVTDDNGQFSQKIAFKKNPDSNGINKVVIRLTFERNNYKIDPSSDDSGDDNLKNDADMDGDGNNDVYYQTGEISPDTTVVLNNVPIKRTHFTETVDGVVETGGTGVNGLTVKIWVNIDTSNPPDYDNVDPDYVTKTETRAIGDGSKTEDGYFSFDNISWDDEDYTGNQSHIDCHIRYDDPLNSNQIDDIDITVYSDSNNFFDLTDQ